MNMFTFTVNFCCLLFWGFLALVYFSKKNMSNLENKLYRYLIYFDFLVLSFSMVCLLSGQYYQQSALARVIYDVSARIYGASEILWGVFLAYYTIITISNSNIKNILNSNNQLIHRIIIIITIIMSVISLILPVVYSFNSENILVYVGPRVDFITYVLVGIGIITTIIILINNKNVNVKKILPFFLFVFLELAAFIIYIFDAVINIFPLSITLISYLMYHTIENPDLKLINQLELAKTQAEKSNQAKSEFLASMSHELRTPLNAIVGLSEMLTVGTDIEEMKQDSKDILVASNNLLELVDEILAINNIETNKMEIVEETYKPVDEFNELIRLTNFRIGGKPIQLRYNFQNIPYELAGDKEKIITIINNLLTNAVKYTEKGFIDFNISAINEKDESTLIITVRDTGRGIRDDQKKYLFSKFYRLEEDRDSDIQGTGLGLSLTKYLVELLNGKIEVESTYGQGSTFKVTLSEKIISLNDNNTNSDKDII